MTAAHPEHSGAAPANAEAAELAKFDAVAARWWDPAGEFRPLHELNPLRVAYIASRASLGGARVLDVGCGGGLLAEGLARLGAVVTGLDLARASLDVARLHALESGLSIDYRLEAVEQHVASGVAPYDVVTCLEMLEHVPDPAAVVAALGGAVRPGGQVFVSTLNRNAKSFALGIVGAEYVLGLVPKGTHQYEKFIRPSELGRWARAAGLDLREITGITYDPFGKRFTLGDDVDVNYLVHFVRPG